MTESGKCRLFRVGMLMLGVGILSACIVGSESDGPTPTSQPIPSATIASSPTSAVTATATTENTPVLPTPTVSSPTPTSTSTPRPTATVTPIPKEALGEIAPLDPSGLPNYTLTTDIELRGVPGQSDFTMSLLIIQAAPDHYYLRSTSGNSGLESWLVDGTTYLTQADGSVAALPADSDTALFSPSLLVQTVPRISSDTLAVNVGPEDVNGRKTTHKRVDGKDLLANANWLPGDGASNIEGQVDIWIDNETGIILRRESNVRWQNPDGSGGELIERHDVTNISTTERVTAPG